MAFSENKQRMLRGELYTAFTPELIVERERCVSACARFNRAVDPSRRELVRLWRGIIQDDTPLPPKLDNEEEDVAQFGDEPWVETPIKFDYGTNVKIGANVFLNSGAIFLDTCLISIGARTLVGPNVSFYAGTHPLDPELRNGTKGPELGKEIHIGEDCWIGGQVIFLPGVTIGKGSTIGAGSVVTKDVPPFHVAAGNPARVIRKIKTNMDPDQKVESVKEMDGAEKPMAEMSKQ